MTHSSCFPDDQKQYLDLCSFLKPPEAPPWINRSELDKIHNGCSSWDKYQELCRKNDQSEYGFMTNFNAGGIVAILIGILLLLGVFPVIWILNKRMRLYGIHTFGKQLSSKREIECKRQINSNSIADENDNKNYSSKKREYANQAFEDTVVDLKKEDSLDALFTSYSVPDTSLLDDSNEKTGVTSDFSSQSLNWTCSNGKLDET